MKKLTIQQVAETCTRLGVEFIDERYKGTSFRHNFKCIKHQKTYNTCLDSLLKKKALRCCLSKTKELNNSTLDKIKQLSLSRGVEFLDPNYVSINHKHYFKCLTHNKISKSSFKHINKGQKLDCCLSESREAKKRSIQDSIVARLKKRGLKLLDNFHGVNERHLVKCLNHNFTKLVRLSAALENNKHLPCCQKIPALAEDVSQKDNKEINKLKEDVKRESDYVCYICRAKQSEKECTAHEIDYRQEGKENYVCLCGVCLTTFRKIYGFKKNTRKQFDDFVEDNRKDPGGRDAVLKKIDWNK